MQPHVECSEYAHFWTVIDIGANLSGALLYRTSLSGADLSGRAMFSDTLLVLDNLSAAKTHAEPT